MPLVDDPVENWYRSLMEDGPTRAKRAYKKAKKVGITEPMSYTNIVATKTTPSVWSDTKQLEVQIEKMMKALRFKLQQDGMFMPAHVDMAGMVYSFLKDHKGYDLRFGDGDLRVLDEFIDSEWPKLMEASKSKPPELEPGWTELPKPKPPVESLFGTAEFTTNSNTADGTQGRITTRSAGYSFYTSRWF